MKKTGLICLLLAFAMLLGGLVGCGNKTPANEDSGTEPPATTAEVTGDPTIADTLAPSYNFDADYRILVREVYKYEFDDSNELGGTAVESAIYSRNKAVEQRANVSVLLETFNGDWKDWTDGSVATLLRNNFNANKSAYDLIAAHSVYLSEMALEGIGMDLSEAPNVDLSKKWWSNGFYRESNYNGAAYFMVGDICLTLYEFIQVIFFNEDWLRDLDDSLDLYTMVDNGKWTFEELKRYTALVTTDPTAGEDDAIYGFLSNGHCHRAIATAFDVNLLPVGEDGKRTCLRAVPESEEKKLQGYIDWFKDTAETYGNEKVADTNKMFASRRTLFYANRLGEAINIKSIMTDDYGVLPFPKYSVDQLSYRSCGRDTMSVAMIPANVADREMAGTVLELMCMESRFLVTDTYYESALKTRAFNDPKCRGMLDLILESMNPTFYTIYNSVLNYPASLLGNVVQNGKKLQFATEYQRLRPEYVAGLTNLYEKLDALAAKKAA
ncbi:MAG TPA: hypothetical protein DDW30_02965 [Clostridiales bacterium]|nr:hypothetical protein [Clostridiales bacterium]